MVDTRFFEIATPVSAAALIRQVDGEQVSISGMSEDLETVLVAGVASPGNDIGIDRCIYANDKANLGNALASNFSMCLINEKLIDEITGEDTIPSGVVVKVKNAQIAFIQIINILYTEKIIECDEHQLHLTARVGENCNIHPTAVISSRAEIGARSSIGPHSVVGPGVIIGNDCTVEAGVTITHSILADGVTIFAGARIGQAGFGFVEERGVLLRMPQLGRVMVHDDVEIGANSTVDRGTLDDTIIGRGTRIDNQVQIAHNVVLGEQCILAAHTGISGSCIVGNNVMFGGKAGLADHLVVGDGARIAANAGCMRDVPAGETWAGAPAMPVRKFMRQVATLAKLTDEKNKKV